MNTASVTYHYKQHLKPFFILSKCFGVLSPSLPQQNLCVMWKIYSAILALAVFATYIEMSILKIMYSPEITKNLFFVLMDILNELFLVMTDVFTIADTTFLKRKLTASFVNLMMKEDLYLYNKNNYKRRQKIFLVEFLCVFFCVILYHAYHLYTFVFRIPYVFGRYVFFREISLYLIMINLLQMYYFVLIIRDKYLFLNKSLRKGIAAAQVDIFNISSKNIDVFLRKYVEYCDLVDVFNRLFGNRIFWIIGYVVIDTVEGFQIGLNCFAHIRIHRLGEDSCEYVGGAAITELSIHTVRREFQYSVLKNFFFFRFCPLCS